jgi:hypothetical protein
MSLSIIRDNENNQHHPQPQPEPLLNKESENIMEIEKEIKKIEKMTTPQEIKDEIEIIKKMPYIKETEIKKLDSIFANITYSFDEKKENFTNFFFKKVNEIKDTNEIENSFNDNFIKIYDSYKTIEEFKKKIENNDIYHYKKIKFISLLIEKIINLNINIPKKLKIFDLFYNFVKNKFFIPKDLKDAYDKNIRNIIFNYENIYTYFNSNFIINSNVSITSIKFDIYIREVLIYYFQIKKVELRLFEIFYTLFNILNIIIINSNKLIENLAKKIGNIENKIFIKSIKDSKNNRLTYNQRNIENKIIQTINLDFSICIDSILNIELYCELNIPFIKNMYDIFNDIDLEKIENNNDKIKEILDNLKFDYIRIETLNNNKQKKNIEQISLFIKNKISKYHEIKTKKKINTPEFNKFYKKNIKSKKSEVDFSSNNKFITYADFNNSNAPNKIKKRPKTRFFSNNKFINYTKNNNMKPTIQQKPIKSALKRRPGFFGKLFGRFTQKK